MAGRSSLTPDPLNLGQLFGSGAPSTLPSPFAQQSSITNAAGSSPLLGSGVADRIAPFSTNAFGPGGNTLGGGLISNVLSTVGFGPGGNTLGAPTSAVPDAPRVTGASTGTGSGPSGNGLGVTTPAADPNPAAQPTTSTPPPSGAIMETILANALVTNSLDNYFNVGYHFRLFCMQDKDLYEQAQNPSSITDLYQQIDHKLPIVTIAETGVTTYNIKDVQIDAVVGPNSETRNFNATKFTITITEPMGVGFLEAMKAACNSLKVINFAKATYFLELTFLGYDVNGNPVSGMFDGTRISNGGRWMWALQIKDIDTRLQSSGGEYTISAIGWSDTSFDADLGAMPEASSVTGTTIGELFSNYEMKLSESAFNRYHGKIVTYKIMIHPFTDPNGKAVDPSTFALKPKQDDISNVRAVSLSSTGTNGPATASIQQGTTTADFIEYALASTEEAQNLALDRDGNLTQTSVSASQTNAKKFKESMVLRIEPDVRINGYDNYSNNYIREITYHIHGHYTQAPVVDRLQRDNSLDPQVQADMLQKILDRKGLSKRYDYLYTGLNTEVIDFDLHYNLVWNGILPKLSGGRAGMENSTVNARLGPQNTDPQGNYTESPAAVIAVQTAQIDQQVADVTQTEQTLANAKIETERLKMNAPNPTAADTVVLAQQQAHITDLTNSIATQNAAINQSRLKLNAIQTAANGETEIKPGGIYAEEIVAQMLAGTSTSATSKLHNVPVGLIQEYRISENTVGTGVTGAYHRDRAVFGSVLAQLYEPDYGQLMNVNLVIRGDPFWLGQGNLERTITMRQNSTAQVTGLPDFWTGDATFLLNFRYPLAVGDNGAPVFNADEVISSLYRVIRVENQFSEGFYKQTLVANRLPLTQIAAALGYAPSSGSSSPNTTSPLAAGPAQSGTASGSVATAASAAQKAAFINSFAAYAQAQSARTGIAPEIILAQAALETGYGSHAPNNNYFGIKGPGSVQSTLEADANGNLVPTTASFAGYESPQASFNGYGNLLATRANYSNLRAVAASGGSLSAQAQALQTSGYATDPNYGANVLSIASSFRSANVFPSS